MTIEIPKGSRELLITSIQRYFAERMDEPIGNMTANALLEFFLAELGPIAYNKGVADVQERLQARVMEVDLEIYADEFTFWKKPARPGKRGA